MQPYNTDLKAPITSEMNSSPKARVHRVEWKKVAKLRGSIIVLRKAVRL
jgi:hypothetical protein